MKIEAPEFLFFNEAELRFVKKLPYHEPLENWHKHNIGIIEFRKGLSRHEVIFINNSSGSFAVKQTTAEAAVSEFNAYIKLLEAGVHTLTPAGCIVLPPETMMTETAAGVMPEYYSRGLFFSRLERESLPEAYLLSLPFTAENKKKILDAAALLLAQLHSKGIYWGDASVSNLLIKFIKLRDELGRVRTELKALLADAETVVMNMQLSKEMRKNELEFVLESFEWYSEELYRQGKIDKKGSLSKDKSFLVDRYNFYFRLLKLNEDFYSHYGIEPFKYFGFIKNLMVLDLLRKQIEEHKWYLSEKKQRRVSASRASAEWLKRIYLPAIQQIKELKIYEHFPFKTAGELYIDLMQHKYYLSEKAGFDVGLEFSINDFMKQFAKQEVPRSFISKLLSIFSLSRTNNDTTL